VAHVKKSIGFFVVFQIGGLRPFALHQEVIPRAKKIQDAAIAREIATLVRRFRTVQSKCATERHHAVSTLRNINTLDRSGLFAAGEND
jgi:hypothetical protein